MNRTGLKAAATRWLHERRTAFVVSVDRAQGSVPRGPGTRMVVSADAVLGTLGGGHLEFKAIERARALLADATDLASSGLAPVLDRYALGPSLGQCCGGVVVLRTEPLTARALADWPAQEPRFELWLYGAGHVGRAIVRLLVDIDCKVRWIDERPQEWAAVDQVLPEVRSAGHIECVCPQAAVDEVGAAPTHALHLVMTHRHDLDLQIATAVLARGDFGFLGVIGSRTKAARFRAQLLNRNGMDPAKVDRMVCPIGLMGIQGKEPAVIAVSVVSQLLHHDVAEAHRLEA